MIAFDLKNAFDTVNWIYLFQRMREVGINSDVINLISKRYRSAKFSSTRKEQRVGKGVPQGSLSNPILFLLIIDLLLHEPHYSYRSQKLSKSLIYGPATALFIWIKINVLYWQLVNRFGNVMKQTLKEYFT